MHEQKETHTKGFLLEQNEENIFLWLRSHGVEVGQVSGSVSFSGRYVFNEKEYVSREFVHGDSLSEFYEKNTCSLPMFVGIIKRAMTGLQALHEREIIHGNISASNLILSAYDMQPHDQAALSSVE